MTARLSGHTARFAREPASQLQQKPARVFHVSGSPLPIARRSDQEQLRRVLRSIARPCNFLPRHGSGIALLCRDSSRQFTRVKIVRRSLHCLGDRRVRGVDMPRPRAIPVLLACGFGEGRASQFAAFAAAVTTSISRDSVRWRSRNSSGSAFACAASSSMKHSWANEF